VSSGAGLGSKLLRAKKQNLDFQQMPDAIGGGAVDHVGEKPMAVRGHRDEIHAMLLGDANEFRRRVDHRKMRADREPERHRQSDTS
jgi:hypothetical protein